VRQQLPVQNASLVLLLPLPLPLLLQALLQVSLLTGSLHVQLNLVAPLRC